MDRFTARRRLLRGSLSAPLVLTVASSPAAAAARGSWEACLLRAGRDPAQAEPFIPGDAHDTWLRLRVPLYKGKLKPPEGEGKALSVQGAEQPAVNSSGQVVGEDLAKGRQPVEKDPTKGDPPGGGSDDKDFYRLEDRYYPLEPTPDECDRGGYAEDEFQNLKEVNKGEIQLLVYVDETGTVVAYGPCPSSGQEGFPVSASCWASFGGMQV